MLTKESLQEWLTERSFNKDQDVIVLPSAYLDQIPSDIKAIGVPSLQNMAVIKSYGNHFDTSVAYDIDDYIYG